MDYLTSLAVLGPIGKSEKVFVSILPLRSISSVSIMFPSSTLGLLNRCSTGNSKFMTRVLHLSSTLEVF